MANKSMASKMLLAGLLMFDWSIVLGFLKEGHCDVHPWSMEEGVIFCHIFIFLDHMVYVGL